jgi:hypothetical protein
MIGVHDAWFLRKHNKTMCCCTFARLAPRCADDKPRHMCYGNNHYAYGAACDVGGVGALGYKVQRSLFVVVLERAFVLPTCCVLGVSVEGCFILISFLSGGGLFPSATIRLQQSVPEAQYLRRRGLRLDVELRSFRSSRLRWCAFLRVSRCFSCALVCVCLNSHASAL